MRNSLILLSVASIVLYFAACKKPNNPAPAKFTGCRITTITEVPADSATYPTTTYHFYYNDDGTVQHIFAAVQQRPYSSYYYYYQSESHYTYFVYKDNIVQVRTVYGTQTTPLSIDTITLDGQKKVMSISNGEYYYSAGLGVDNYWYDSTGNMYLHTRNQGGAGVQYLDSVYWQGGDVARYVSYISGNLTANKSYLYYDTLINTGNITSNLSDFEIYGRSIFTSKHLVKQIFDNYTDSTWTYNYVLDAGGKITNVTETQDGGGVSTTQITYNCE
jgi:hypothetical protein